MTGTKRRVQRKAFTLIELLVVILIMAILMAIALPLYLGAVAKSERAACRANMEAISNAEQAYRVRNPPNYTYTTDLSNLTKDLGTIPACPTLGTYSVVVSDGTTLANSGVPVPAGQLVVRCSAGHGVFAPSIDAE